MHLRFPLVLGAFGLLCMVGSEFAEADRARVRFGGGHGSVHVQSRAGGMSSVHWSRPARVFRPRASWSVGGSIFVGTTPRFRHYRPYYYSDAYVPSYYGTSYYPVAPAAAPSVIVAVSRPQLPKLGIGLFAGGSSVHDVSESSDLGVLGRLRLGNGGLMIEGELGKTSYESDLRVDRRLGASVLYEIGAYNRFAPYVVGGFGVQQADVAGSYESMQNFAEIGVGLRYAVTAKFHLAVDVRAGTRNTMTSDDPSTRPVQGTIARTITPPSSDSDESEEYTRARFSAFLYF